MSKEDEVECMWVITHDTKLQHFFLEFHADSRLTPREFLDELSHLLDQYEDKPDEMFDGAQTIEAQ